MKIYKLYTNPYEEMDLEEAIDWLKTNCHFTLDCVTTVEESTNQSEMIDVLIDAYFIIEETDEEDNSWEDDTEERQREYRREQI
jgi:hypothetical protein